MDAEFDKSNLSSRAARKPDAGSYTVYAAR